MFWSLIHHLIHPNKWVIVSVQFFLFLIFFSVIYWIIKRLVSNEHIRANFQLLAFSIFFVLWISELVLLYIGIKDTYVERRDDIRSIETNYINSEFKPYPKNSFHLLESQEFSYERHTNEYGFSDKSWNDTVGADFRIMVLGDSFTEGDGTSFDSTWVNLTEKKFIDRDFNVRFYNAGLCGSDLVYEYVTMERNFDVIRPNLVLVAFHSQDFREDLVKRGGFERFQYADRLMISFKEILYGYSRIARLIMENLFGYNELLIKNNDSQLDKIIHEQSQEIIDKYQTFSKNKDLKILFLNIDGGHHNEKWTLTFHNILEGTEMELLNLRECLLSNHEDVLYWKIDGHFTPLGNEILSNCLEEKLSKYIE